MNNLERIKLPVWLIIGIIFVPIIFVWFTLKQGYSKKARIISFSWMVPKLRVLVVALWCVDIRWRDKIYDSI